MILVQGYTRKTSHEEVKVGQLSAAPTQSSCGRMVISIGFVSTQRKEKRDYVFYRWHSGAFSAREKHVWLSNDVPLVKGCERLKTVVNLGRLHQAQTQRRKT